MDELTKKNFDKAYEKLRDWLTLSYEEFLQRYEIYPEECTLEEINNYYYLLFCYPIDIEGGSVLVEQGILLVYDGDDIIADLAFMHAQMDDVMRFQRVSDKITSESDWSYLQHYTLSRLTFPDIPYPSYKEDIKEPFIGEACFFTNIYVTKRFRQQHIFTNMLEVTKEMVLRYCIDYTCLYSVISLDPDVACYGEDTQEEPYIYSMKDEPTRLLNKKILEKLGYFVVKLEVDDLPEDDDGTKVWFAVCKENEHIVIHEKNAM